MKKVYSLTLLMILIAFVAEAQSIHTLRRDRSLIATVGLNTSTYYGDLKDDSDIIDAKPSLSMGLMTGLSRKVYIRGEFSWLSLSGKDLPEAGSGRAGRNLSFHSNNYEFDVSGIYYFRAHRRRFYQRPNFNAYAFLGVGGLYFNPMATLDGEEYVLQPLETEGVRYSRFAFIIPFGGGVMIKLTPFANLGVEAGWRKTSTDYIDDVSTVHIDNSSISNPITKRLTDRRPEVNLPLVAPGNKRGNPKAKDAYMLLSLKLEYYLPYQLGHHRKLYPRQRRPYYR